MKMLRTATALAAIAAAASVPMRCEYEFHAATHCNGRNELGGSVTNSAEACQYKCDQEPTCVGSEWYNDGSGTCHLSTTCTASYFEYDDPNWTYSVKGACQEALYCVSARTTEDSGYLAVEVIGASGVLRTVDLTLFNVGDDVLVECFAEPVTTVSVQDVNNNAWRGVVEYSTDGGQTFTHMECSDCNIPCLAEGVPAFITVDGNNDSGSTECGCVNQAKCHLVPGVGDYCVKMVTGSNGGYVSFDVLGSDNKKLWSKPSVQYVVDELVFDECFPEPVVAVSAQNSNADAWTGTVQYSTDGGLTKSTMQCTDCTTDCAGSGSRTVTFDGNDDSGSDCGCRTGQQCNLVPDVPGGDYCVKIATGDESGNGGYPRFTVTAGDSIVTVGGDETMLARGTLVMNRCFSDPIDAVEGGAATTNAWAGSLQDSIDGGSTWSTMACEDCDPCAADSPTVVVDGNDDGGSQATCACLNGRECRFAATASLAPTSAPSAAPTNAPTQFSTTVDLSVRLSVPSRRRALLALEDDFQAALADALGVDAKDIVINSVDLVVNTDNEYDVAFTLTVYGDTAEEANTAASSAQITVGDDSFTVAGYPTVEITDSPTVAPTDSPTVAPTDSPTDSPTSEGFQAAQLADEALEAHPWTTGVIGDVAYKCHDFEGCYENTAALRKKFVVATTEVDKSQLNPETQHNTTDGSFIFSADGIVFVSTDGMTEYHFPHDCQCSGVTPLASTVDEALEGYFPTDAPTDSPTSTPTQAPTSTDAPTDAPTAAEPYTHRLVRNVGECEDGMEIPSVPQCQNAYDDIRNDGPQLSVEAWEQSTLPSGCLFDGSTLAFNTGGNTLASSQYDLICKAPVSG